MKPGILAGSLLTCLVLSAPLSAQQVSTRVIVRSNPSPHHVIVDRGYSSYRGRDDDRYRRPEARRAGVEREAPRMIVVERVPAYRRAAYQARREYRRVTLYYVNGRYYDRYVAAHGVRTIVVYERGGRFYDACD
jgi:hypothetical protein